jgi:hypothetical protein
MPSSTGAAVTDLSVVLHRSMIHRRYRYPPAPMRLGGSELLVIVVFVIPTVWALFDILQTGTDVWAASNQDQWVWVLVVLLLPVIGAILFFWIARPRLKGVR